MKKLAFLLSLCVAGYIAKAQTTLTLQPDGAAGKDAWITTNPATNNFGVYPNFAAIAWSSSGNNFISRGLLEFDLSAVPAGATILSAKLSLYCNTTSDHTQLHSSLSGSNACYLNRITGSWSENTVTWNNQPNTTATNQVSLAQSDSATQDYLNIDILQLIKDQRGSSSPNAIGLMLQLIDEEQYRSLIFANSDHTNPLKRPKLVITYSTSSTPCIRIRPNAANGKDAWITSNPATTNFGVYPNFAAIAWSNGGNNFVSRGLIEFDLSAVPSNSTLSSAYLSLYCNTTSDHSQLHSSLSGSNACYLSRTTSAWDENTVNWNNKPSTTSTHQVTLAQSTSNTQDYTNIDVLNLVTDQRNSAAPNAMGLMLQLIEEQQYRSLIFANSDHADSTKWPVLELCYTLPSGLSQLNKNESDIIVYPNPAQRNAPLSIMLNNASEATVAMYDIQGQLIFTETYSTVQQEIVLNNSLFANLPAGTYLLRVNTPAGISTHKFVLQ